MTPTFPTRSPSGQASAAVLTAFQAVACALYHANDPTFRSTPPTPVQMQDVSVNAGGHLNFTLQQGQRREHFTCGGEWISGRGGSFAVRDPSDLRRLLDTVCEDAPTSQSFLGLRERLAERGFVLRAGPAHAFKYQFMLRSLRAEHPDGRVLWLGEYDQDFRDGQTAISVSAGPHWLGCFYDGADQDTYCLMASTDAELAELGLTAPEQVTPSRYAVSGDALDALLERVPGDHLAFLSPLPHAVPADFFRRPDDFLSPAHTTTRAACLAQREARTKRPPEPGGPDEERGLPF